VSDPAPAPHAHQVTNQQIAKEEKAKVEHIIPGSNRYCGLGQGKPDSKGSQAIINLTHYILAYATNNHDSRTFLYCLNDGCGGLSVYTGLLNSHDELPKKMVRVQCMSPPSNCTATHQMLKAGKE
jgi:hypothetical protein